MAKFWYDPDLVYEQIYEVSKDSADEVLKLVGKRLRRRAVHPYATGELASSYYLEVESLTSEGVTQVIRSDSPYANAIENGAWTGGRGPHISGSGNIIGGRDAEGRGTYTGKGRGEVESAVKSFGGRMTKRLKSAAL